MTRRHTDGIVEVIAPTGAPHLARIADELAVRVREQIETLPTDALSRLLRESDAIAKAREEFERFRRRFAIR